MIWVNEMHTKKYHHESHVNTKKTLKSINEEMGTLEWETNPNKTLKESGGSTKLDSTTLG